METPSRLFDPQVDALFEKALSLPHAERNALLQHLKTDQPELHLVLETLLSQVEQAEVSFNEATPIPQNIGPYQILEPIGTGATCRVFRARDTRLPDNPYVAIKLFHGQSQGHYRELARGESHILAQLDHPNIARGLGSGQLESGMAYLIMEYVDGPDLLHYCLRERLNLEQRLHLFLQACKAVHFAHQRGIVHRDLKPAHLMVQDGQIKLLDFGLAKLLMDTVDYPTCRAFLTPRYASPERVQGQPATVSCDLFSLGVILCQLIADTFPDGADQATGFLNFQAWDRPSAFITNRSQTDQTAGAQARGMSVKQWIKAVRGDLDAIALKAAHPDAHQRYAHVSDLIADLEAYQSGRPVQARAGLRTYLLAKWVQNHPKWSFALTSLLGALIAATLFLGERTHRIQQERDQAVVMAQFLASILQNADPKEKGPEVRMVDVLDEARAALLARPNQSIAEPQARLEILPILAKTYSHLGKKAEALPLWEEAYSTALTTDVSAEKQRQLQLDLAQCLVDLGAFGRAASLLEMDPFQNQFISQALPNRLIQAQIYMELGSYSQALAVLPEPETWQSALTPSEQAELLYRRSQALAQLGQFEQALDQAEQAVHMQRRIVGKDPSLVLKRENHRAKCLRYLDRYDDALAAVESVLDRQCQLLGPDHPDYADALANHALILMGLGRLTPAKLDLDAAIGILERDAESHLLTLVDYQNSRAMLLRKMDRLDESEAEYRTVLPRAAFCFGNPSAQVLTLKANLAVCLGQQGRREEALDLLNETTEQRRLFYGPDHPIFLNSRYLLGWSWLEVDPVKAEEILAEVYASRKRVLGTDSLDTAMSAYGWALALRDTHQPKAAADLLREAYQIRMDLLGPHHLLTLFAMDGLLTVLQETAPDEAVQWANELIQKTQESDLSEKKKQRFLQPWTQWSASKSTPKGVDLP
ncbi:MAG: serine/threonine protein kinase [Acidobacteria bacterium]|nr:serine/threonine protein kinase [Acidobacteriota bacterium]MCB9399137.1 serine/threonine protein kinase [Acidobacteriota bacterium]